MEIVKMFSFFKKTEVDNEKVNSFVEWFCANEKRIRKSVENRATNHNEMMLVLDEVEVQLAKVYRDGYKGRIEFDYGGKEQEWELNLYHLNNKFLVCATSLIAAAFENAGLSAWKINIGK